MLLTDCFNFTQFQISLFYCLHDILFDSDQVCCTKQTSRNKISYIGGTYKDTSPCLISLLYVF